MSPEQRAEVLEWIQRADDDLRAAELDLNAVPPLTGDALFHCQQAVEKAMKGFLAARDQVFSKTHDLEKLASQCEAVEPGMRMDLDPVKVFSQFAWQFRYPGSPALPPIEEARKTVATARKAVEAIRSRTEGLLGG